MRRALVTGASGFLGRHLLGALSADRWCATALVRDEQGWRSMDWTHTLANVQPHVGGLEEAHRCAPCDAIVHLAAEVHHSRQGTARMLRTNVDGTLAMVRLAHAWRARLIFVSTSGTVGCSRRPGVPVDEHAPYATAEVGRWPYYASKIEAEQRATALARDLGVELVLVRPPVLLGPGDHRARSTGHVTRVLERRLVAVPRGGMHFVDVRDVARALVRVLERASVEPVYHLPGHEMPLARFFTKVARLGAVPVPKRSIPPWLLERLAAAGQLYASRTGRKPPLSLPDPVVAEMSGVFWPLASRYSERDLDHRPRDASETLRETIAWLRSGAPTTNAEPAFRGVTSGSRT